MIQSSMFVHTNCTALLSQHLLQCQILFCLPLKYNCLVKPCLITKQPMTQQVTGRRHFLQHFTLLNRSLIPMRANGLFQRFLQKRIAICKLLLNPPLLWKMRHIIASKNKFPFYATYQIQHPAHNMLCKLIPYSSLVLALIYNPYFLWPFYI